MSEIDVSKCDYYFQGRCGVSKNINYSIGCHANDCYYKQLQQLKEENELLKNERTIDLRNQLEQLKAENEELKQEIIDLKDYWENKE